MDITVNLFFALLAVVLSTLAALIAHTCFEVVII